MISDAYFWLGIIAGAFGIKWIEQGTAKALMLILWGGFARPLLAAFKLRQPPDVKFNLLRLGVPCPRQA